MRQKTDFTCPIKAESTVHPRAQKYFAHPDGQIIFMTSGRLLPEEGRIAIVTDVGQGDAVDASMRQTSAFEADGEVVWS